MSKKHNIEWRLLLQYMNADISVHDKKRVEDWFQASPRHWAYYQRMVTSWNNDELYLPEMSKLLQQFEDFTEKRRRQKHLYLILGRSIAALLFISLCTIWYFSVHTKPDIPTFPIATLVPGSHKAVLITGNQVITLGYHTDSSIWINNTIKINQKLGKITFSQNHSQQDSQYYTILTPRGGEYHAVLEDGTAIWLNAGSELRFPNHFRNTERKVFLSGEAYFKVAHHPSRPFTVETELGEIKVFGTEFNIRYYQQEEKMKTTLVRGSIGFTNNITDSCIKITPGYQINCGKNIPLQIRQVKIYKEIAWKNRQFCFERQPLKDIMEEIGRWYDATIIFDDDTLKELRFTMTLNRYEKIETLLHYFEASDYNLTFQIQGKNIIIKKNKDAGKTDHFLPHPA